MPFAVRRIQTDRGNEIFAEKFQRQLMEWAIKFRPIEPASPHLNGKVERAQLTVLDEFYATVDIKSPELSQELSEWQHYYDWQRPHTSLNGETPIDVNYELMPNMPYVDDVVGKHDISKERFQEQN